MSAVIARLDSPTVAAAKINKVTAAAASKPCSMANHAGGCLSPAKRIAAIVRPPTPMMASRIAAVRTNRIGSMASFFLGRLKDRLGSCRRIKSRAVILIPGSPSHVISPQATPMGAPALGTGTKIAHFAVPAKRESRRTRRSPQCGPIVMAVPCGQRAAGMTATREKRHEIFCWTQFSRTSGQG